jgi:uncharacterized membrane protein
METTTQNQSLGIQVTRWSSTPSPVDSVMRLLCRLLLMLALAYTANPSVAAPLIAINFEQEQGSKNEWIHAKANCHTTEQQLYEVLNAIVKYPALHSWIRDTKIESNTMNGGQQFLIEFKFPWPVGKRWSRVEVKREGDSIISWRQLEGSLKKNQGRIEITEHKQQAHIDYRAIIDVGYPNAFTRGYKKKFVSEFLEAIYDQTRDLNQPSTETSASFSQTKIATFAP